MRLEDIVSEECHLWLEKGHASSLADDIPSNLSRIPDAQPPKPLRNRATQGLEARTRWTRFSAYFGLFHQHV